MQNGFSFAGGKLFFALMRVVSVEGIGERFNVELILQILQLSRIHLYLSESICLSLHQRPCSLWLLCAGQAHSEKEEYIKLRCIRD